MARVYSTMPLENYECNDTEARRDNASLNNSDIFRPIQRVETDDGIAIVRKRGGGGRESFVLPRNPSTTKLEPVSIIIERVNRYLLRQPRFLPSRYISRIMGFFDFEYNQVRLNLRLKIFEIINRLV